MQGAWALGEKLHNPRSVWIFWRTAGSVFHHQRRAGKAKKTIGLNLKNEADLDNKLFLIK